MPIYRFLISASFSVLTIAWFGCVHEEKNSDKLFDRISQGLKMSVKTLESANRSVYREFKNKLADPATREKALQWESKSTQVMEASQNIRTFINSLIALTENENISRNLSDSLFFLLQSYRSTVLAVDDQLKELFKREYLNLEYYFSTTESPAEFYTACFGDRSTYAIIAALYNLNNCTSHLENVVLSFCNTKSHVIIDRFDTFSAIVAQSTNTVEQGDDIEITAGVGAFSRSASPIINIGGKTIALDENAVAIYKFKATGAIGAHSVPVKIAYVDPNGVKRSKVFTLNYKIRE